MYYAVSGVHVASKEARNHATPRTPFTTHAITRQAGLEHACQPWHIELGLPSCSSTCMCASKRHTDGLAKCLCASLTEGPDCYGSSFETTCLCCVHSLQVKPQCKGTAAAHCVVLVRFPH
jgi:hypothetical protein